MIIVNGVPKSGTTLLVSYLRACGLALEPGGLIADASSLTMVGGAPWRGVRSLEEVLAHDGCDRVIGAHVSDGFDLSPHKVAFIIRHPRNILVSWARWVAVGMNWTGVNRQPDPAQVRSLIDADAVAILTDRLRAYSGWLGRADAFVRFEDFGAAAPRLAVALGVAAVDPIGVMGDNGPWVTGDYRGTWSGAHSEWAKVWDADLDRLWWDAGGPALEADYGYRA